MPLKLSTRVRYGLRAMVDLAVHYEAGPVQARDVARRQEVSRKYLENLLGSLKAAGLVRTARGNKGGYRLARPPGEITAEDVVRALDSLPVLVACVEDPSVCRRAKDCAVLDLWREASGGMLLTLRRFSLARLAENTLRKMDTPVTYQI